MLICQLTDLHVRPDEAAANPETNTLTERACRVAAAFTPLPDVVIITGDLTESGLEAEYANLSAILGRTLAVPVYVVPGNHDQRENLRAGLAHLPGVTADPYFVQYAVEDYPVRLVMLDTLVPGANHGAQSAAQSWRSLPPPWPLLFQNLRQVGKRLQSTVEGFCFTQSREQ